MSMEDEERANALEDSIKQKAGKSYYYAHEKRDTGELRAPDPEPEGKLIKKTVSVESLGESLEASALDDNIAMKKDQSYYYAHARRETGEAPAPMPVPVVLARETRPTAPTIEAKAIQSYSFLDEDEVVKIYVPLEGVKEAVGQKKEAVCSSFGEKTLELTVSGYEEGKVLKLGFASLFEEIVPEESKHRVLANKVVLALKKKKKNISWNRLV
ncbi:hypothetical protein CYMTET_22174 [Cymbomonas tetramitiformis]|uniref:CS domain-containing protein n=1 Tax=Cymbomonas tetramitiformis TaxID=36881 RepID=A0AAE0G0P6_9CHLO|nr:hypothetical protein CYMTET_22174 [Cymbomonas tetramitiformis]